jgi:hypothetical protein
MRLAYTTVGSTLFLSLFAACATDSSTTAGDDQLAGETGDGEAAKADGVDTFGIFTAQKVGAFECNGAGSCTHVALTRANRSTTTCADGGTKASCDVRTLDFSKLHLSSSKLADAMAKLQASAATPDIGAQLLVRGAYVHGTNPTAPGVDWVTFQVTELWTAQLATGTLDGTFVMVADNNIRCITAPCPTVSEARVNSSRAMNTEGLDWGDSNAQGPTALQDQVGEAMGQPDGVIVTGFRTHDTGHASTNYRTVEQLFLRVK